MKHFIGDLNKEAEGHLQGSQRRTKVAERRLEKSEARRRSAGICMAGVLDGEDRDSAGGQWTNTRLRRPSLR